VLYLQVQLELSGGMLDAFDADTPDRSFRVQGDEEAIPFRNDCFDIVVSNLSMHWVNDLPGCLTQVCVCARACFRFHSFAFMFSSHDSHF
jgi:SAM-dependent methyltransferase